MVKMMTKLQGSTIVVTGVSSFIGMHLALYLSRQKFRVIATTSNPVDSYSGIQALRLKVLKNSNVFFEKLNLLNAEEITSLVNQYRPSVWVHHAAWAQNYASLDFDFNKAINIGCDCLPIIYQALKNNNAQGVVITGSNAEYRDSDHPSSEDELSWPTMPYGLAKLVTNMRAQQLAVQYHLSTRVGRVFIPVGLFDHPKKLISSVVRSLLEKQPIALSPCTQQRDFIYINDLVSGFESLLYDLDRDSIFDIFNLCSGVPVSLKSFLLNIATELNADPSLLQFGQLAMRPGEALISYGSNQKAVAILDWAPKTFQEGMDHFLRDYKKGELS